MYIRTITHLRDRSFKLVDIYSQCQLQNYRVLGSISMICAYLRLQNNLASTQDKFAQEVGFLKQVQQL